jgi:hypothetical protein
VPTLARRTWLLAIAFGALLAFALKIALALNTYGTNDVIFWEGNLAKIRLEGGLALYRNGVQIFRDGALYHTEPFNQPPFMIHLLRLWGWVADASGLPLRFWLRFTSALADIGSLVLVARILTRLPGLKRQHPALLLVALSPVSIMVSGFHGNTDAVMIFWTLLSIDLLESGRPEWLAGAALGMAMNIKVVPAVLAPAAIFYLSPTRRRIEFALGAGAIFLACSLPVLAQDPRLVLDRVFGYNSLPKHWGLSRLLHVVTLGNAAWLDAGYQSVGKLAALAAVLAAAIRMNLRSKKPPLFLQWGFLLFLFLFCTPGFGVQYLAWLVPWGAALSGRAILLYYAASSLFLFEVYTYWSRGLPWYLADMLYTRDLKGSLLYFSLETLAWIAVGCVVLASWRNLKLVPAKDAAL